MRLTSNVCVLTAFWIATICAGPAISPATVRAAQEYPVIIIGSGFGGSIAAYNLAKEGVRSIVLERGRWWTVKDPAKDDTFATLPSTIAGDGRGAWLSELCRGSVYLSFTPDAFKCAVTTGILEVLGAEVNTHDRSPAIRTEGIWTLEAAGVGGGSLVYNGVSYVPLKQAWDVAFPHGKLPYMQEVWDQLHEEETFDRVLSMIDPSPVPDDVLVRDAYAGTRSLRDAAVAAGYPLEDGTEATRLHGSVFVPLAVDWDTVREELSGKRTASASIGEAWWGLNSGAKRSLDKPDHYLGKALASGNTQVKALHTATRIRFDPVLQLYTIEGFQTDEDYNELDRFELTTKHLILSAGSMGTTKLLVRARDTGDLPALNQHVGTHWSSNGTGNSFRLVQEQTLSQGGPGGMKLVNYDDPDNPVVLENLPQRVPEFFASDPNMAPFLGAQLIIGLGIPTSTGNFTYERATDTVVLQWQPEAGQRIYDKFIDMLKELPGTPRIIEQASSQQVTAHPLGGVPLGLATDLNCKLDGYDQLYAVDGSLVPGAAAATNPSVLISALSQRCMDRIVTRIKHGLH